MRLTTVSAFLIYSVSYCQHIDNMVHDLLLVSWKDLVCAGLHDTGLDVSRNN